MRDERTHAWVCQDLLLRHEVHDETELAICDLLLELRWDCVCVERLRSPRDNEGNFVLYEHLEQCGDVVRSGGGEEDGAKANEPDGFGWMRVEELEDCVGAFGLGLAERELAREESWPDKEEVFAELFFVPAFENGKCPRFEGRCGTEQGCIRVDRSLSAVMKAS